MGVEVVLTLLVELLRDILDKVVLEDMRKKTTSERTQQRGGKRRRKEEGERGGEKRRRKKCRVRERCVSCEGEMCVVLHSCSLLLELHPIDSFIP
jgi:hypothetical protein